MHHISNEHLERKDHLHLQPRLLQLSYHELQTDSFFFSYGNKMGRLLERWLFFNLLVPELTPLKTKFKPKKLLSKLPHHKLNSETYGWRRSRSVGILKDK